MPFLALTKGAKIRGIQTHARAIKLPEPLRGVELDYLSQRQWYVEQLNMLAQLGERLSQAKACNDNAEISVVGNRINGVNSQLRDVKDRVRIAGERSWAEAYLLAASLMLPEDVHRAISEEADRILGRPRHELARRE